MRCAAGKKVRTRVLYALAHAKGYERCDPPEGNQHLPGSCVPLYSLSPVTPIFPRERALRPRHPSSPFIGMLNKRRRQALLRVTFFF